MRLHVGKFKPWLCRSFDLESKNHITSRVPKPAKATELSRWCTHDGRWCWIESQPTVMHDHPDRLWTSVVSTARPASCVWHVVGLQRSVREWAMRQGWGGRSVRVEAGAGDPGGGARGAGGALWVQPQQGRGVMSAQADTKA